MTSSIQFPNIAPMKNNCIDLTYLIENSYNDALFIKEILQTTQEEFRKLIQYLASVKDSNQFSSDDMYAILHKYKPTASMYAIDTYPIFEKYGSGNNLITYDEFMTLKNTLIENLEEVVDAIDLELSKY